MANYKDPPDFKGASIVVFLLLGGLGTSFVVFGETLGAQGERFYRFGGALAWEGEIPP